MGALHEGHLALVREAKARAAHVAVSIFVNPLQFGVGEDLAAYPRPLARDAELLTTEGVALLWAPPVEAMYPAGFATHIRRHPRQRQGSCGAARPGHFDGVATVVRKLFNQVQPDIALFGEKDWQQLQVVRRMAADLDLDVEIAGVPTQRGDDGLALSSRNAYLAEDERSRAVALPRALGVAARRIAHGEEPADVLADAHETLVGAGFQVDYVALVDAETLSQIVPDRPRRLLAAARLGTTRLIDNVGVD